MQMLLTPVWMGFFGWVSQALDIVAVILIFLRFGWIWAAVFLIYSLFGLAMLDMVLPFPTYSYCFRVIKQSLKRDIRSSFRHPLSALMTDDHRRRIEMLTELAKAVDDIEVECFGKKHPPI